MIWSLSYVSSWFVLKILPWEVSYEFLWCKKEGNALLACQPMTFNLVPKFYRFLPSHAEALEASGKPYIFASGYGESEILPEFARHPILVKPYQADKLVSALKTLLCAHSSAPPLD